MAERVTMTINHGDGTSGPLGTQLCPPEGKWNLEGLWEDSVQAAVLEALGKRIQIHFFMILS